MKTQGNVRRPFSKETNQDPIFSTPSTQRYSQRTKPEICELTNQPTIKELIQKPNWDTISKEDFVFLAVRSAPLGRISIRFID